MKKALSLFAVFAVLTVLSVSAAETKVGSFMNKLNQKEQEFINATRDHIYTAEKIDVAKEEIIIDENLTLSQKLKLLRTKFDNGEITYEEYQSRRKGLM